MATRKAISNAVIYCRISEDAELSGLGVARQEKECRALAEKLGWKVKLVLTDNDTSASKRSVRRKNYEALLDMMRNRELDALIAWAPDRLHRRPIQLEEFIDIFEERPFEIQMVTAGHWDLSTPGGRANARILGVIARMETEQASARQKAKQRQLAEDGMKAGGGRKPFGYDATGTKLVPREAKAIKIAVEQLIAGETSPHRIAKQWRESGLWPNAKSTGVIRCLTAARIAGKREYEGVLYDNVPWKAIVEWSDVLALRTALAPRNKPRSPGRSFLLTGLLTCGNCGKALRSNIMATGQVRYQCRGGEHGGCGKVGIDAKRTAAIIAEDLFELAETSAAKLNKAVAKQTAKRRTDVADTADQLVELQDRAHRMTEQYALGELDEARYKVAIAAIDRKIADLGDVIAEPVPVTLPVNLRAEWDEMTLHAKRALIETWCPTITIAVNRPDRQFFDPTRIVIVFRGATAKRRAA